MIKKSTILLVVSFLLGLFVVGRDYAQPTLMDWRITALNDPEPGYLHFDYLELGGFFVMDNYGNPLHLDSSHIVYYNPTKDGGWISISDRYNIYDKNMNFVDSISIIPELQPDFHEFGQLSNGHFLLLYNESYIKDMSALVPGGKSNAEIISNVLIETDPSGKIYWEWHAKDHFNILDVSDEIELKQNTIDFTHANAFDEDSDGNIYVSFRHLDEITKINKATGEIMWRFGGSKCKNNQFTILNDEINGFKGFSHQHSVSVLPNGNILMYDNGNLKPNPYSRAVEYQLNEVNKTATKVWEYVSFPLAYSVALGSAYRLPDGNTLINWASNRILEVKPDGSIALELTSTTGKTVYRARKTLLGMHAVTRQVDGPGAYSFDDSTNTTGTVLAFSSLDGSGSVSVAKHDYPPPQADYKDTTYTYIYPARWVITKKNIVNFQAKIVLKVASLTGVRNPSKLKLYGRNRETIGQFKEIATIYNESTQTLEANVGEFGEFVLGVFELGPPALIFPAKDQTCVSIAPTFTWAAPGASKNRLQVSTTSNFSNMIVDATINNGMTDYAASGLSYDSKYYWRVEAANSVETSEWTPVRSFRTELPAPQLLSPDNRYIGIKQGDLATWTSAAGAANYRMQISNRSDFTTIIADITNLGSTQTTFPKLNYNTKHYWRVKGYRGADSSRWSVPREFTTILDSPRLSTPDSGSVNAPLAGELLWSAVKGADSYSLQISDSPVFEELIVDAKEINPTAYDYTGLEYNKQYFWRVKSVRQTDESEWSAPSNFTTLIAPPVLKIPKQDATVKVYDITLWWEVPEGAKKYKLQVSRSAAFADTLLYLSSLYYPAFTLSEAPANSQVYWRVMAYDNSKRSDWSEVGKFSTLGAPGLASPELTLPENDAETDNYGALTWSKISRINFYRAQISDKPDFSNLVMDSAYYAINWREYKGLRPSTRYYWRVKGYSYFDSSAWSGTRSFTVKALSAVRLLSPANDQNLTSIPTKFAWEPMNGAKSYELEIADEVSFANPLLSIKDMVKTELEVPTLQRFSHYFWRVRHIADMGVGPWSVVRSFTTIPYDSISTPSLSYPYNYNGGVDVNGYISWHPVQGAERYRVAISNDYNFENISLKEADVADTLIHYSGLKYNNWYFWRVSAIGENSESGWSPTRAFTTALETPQLISPANNTEEIPAEGKLTWSDLPDVDNYFVQISSDSAFTESRIFSKEFEPEFNYSLGKDSVYYWRVASVNFGNYSKWSEPYKFKTAADKGVGDAPSVGTTYLYPNPAVDFVWINSDKYLGKNYEIYDATGRPVAKGTVTSQKLSVSTLPAGAYYAQIEGDIFMLIKN